MKVGVFGGTFDPIHIGHLIVAEEARICAGLDRVIFIPAGQPWFKADRDITSGCHRIKMIELAVVRNRHVQVLDMELKRRGLTYSVDTLLELKEAFGEETKLSLIIGLDALREVDQWNTPERILELATLVGVARPGYEVLERRPLESIRHGASGEVTVIEGPLIGVSSSEIRRRVYLGTSIRYLVPEPVEAYIYEYGLYKADKAMTRDE